MPLTEFEGLAELVRRVGPGLGYVRASVRGAAEVQPVLNLHLDRDEPLLLGRLGQETDPAALMDAFVETMREELEAYEEQVDGYETVRVVLYRPKGDYLASRTITVNGTPRRSPPATTSAGPDTRVSTVRIDNVDDLLTQRFVAAMAMQQTHVEQMAANYQRLFDLVERILAKVAGLMEQRASKAERHALDLLDKRIAEKRLELDLTADDRKKEGEVAVKEKAIETAGNVAEKLLGGVLSMVGIDPGALGGLGALAKIIETDPELKTAISDPSALAAFSDPEVRGVMVGFLKNYKKASPEDAAEA
jgi:hypothetical protein